MQEDPVRDMEELYTQGSCHVFAIAAWKNHPDPLGFHVVFDPTETVWEDEADSDNVIHAVVHVFAIVREDGEEVALDVLGRRPLQDCDSECSRRYGTFLPVSEDFHQGPEDLDHLVDGRISEDDFDRPLHAYSEEDLLEAAQAFFRIFPEFAPDGAPHP